jgi:hypothetical protein
MFIRTRNYTRRHTNTGVAITVYSTSLPQYLGAITTPPAWGVMEFPVSISVSAPPRNDPPPSAADVERARGPTRPGLISTERENRIRYRLTLFRDHIVEELKTPFVTAEMILPDPVLEDIVNNVKHIVTLQQLHRTMEKHHSHVRQSLLSEEDVKRMMVMIDMAMTEQIEWTTPRLSVDTSIPHDGK